jgi:hypothetical protein
MTYVRGSATIGEKCDFRVRTLRRVLDETIAQALSFGEEETS